MMLYIVTFIGLGDLENRRGNNVASKTWKQNVDAVGIPLATSIRESDQEWPLGNHGLPHIH